MKLFFQPYKEHQKPSPYATWASVLVNVAPGLQDGLESDLIGPPTWLGRPCCPPKVVAKVEDVLHHS
jgi:hypothetical protein